MSDDLMHLLLEATDEEFEAWVGCPHNGETYVELGPLTGTPHTRCSDCHAVVDGAQIIGGKER